MMVAWGGGVGDAARKVRRQREKVIRQRETDYWNTLGGVIREETWQVNFRCAVVL